MARNVYFSHGTRSEQLFHEDLVVESLSIFGQTFYYIPRILVGKDEILGEDRLSKFKSAFAIEMYLENVDGFDGQGAFIQKFGLMMEQSATLVVARRKWEQLIGRFGQTQLPNRPCEGDLLYFPMTDGLFEIKFVQHQDPFYQQNKLFVYKLQVELFQYASEVIDTGIKDIDDFETLKSYDTSVTKSGLVTDIIIKDSGEDYMFAPTVVIGNDWVANTFYDADTEICTATKRYIVTVAGTTSSTPPTHNSTSTNGSATLLYLGARATATAQMGSDLLSGEVMYIQIDNAGNGYQVPPPITFIGSNSRPTVAIALIENMDNPMSFGDNNKFKEEGAGFIFNENNPFGDVTAPTLSNVVSADSIETSADTTLITADKV